MKFFKSPRPVIINLLVISIIFLSSCVTPKKMDNYIASQYDNETPKVNKRKEVSNIVYSSSLPADPANISSTKSHTKVLPLILYWVIDSRQISTLNSEIAATGFSNAVNIMAGKGLSQKLNGRKLELTIEQAPSIFSLVDKLYVILLLIHWEKVYIEPDVKSLVVSYKLYDDNNTIKTGTITVKNTEKNKGLRFFQSWKSAVAEHLTDYDTDITAMTNQFVAQLMEEL